METRAIVRIATAATRRRLAKALRKNPSRSSASRQNRGPRRIVYLNHGADLGGAEISLLELLRGLDRERFEPFVVCPTEGDFVSVLRQERIPCQILALHRLRELDPLPYLATVEQLSGLCRTLNAALVHSNSIYASQFGNPAGIRAGIPTVCHIREWLESEYGIASFMLDVADRTVCVSNAILKRYVALGGDARNAVAIHSGIRREPWESGCEDFRNELMIPPGSSIVSFVGRIDPNKRPHLFLRAAQRIHTVLPDVHFVLAGSSFAGHLEYRRRFDDEFMASGMASHFHRLSFRCDVGRLLAASSALAFTSRHEGFPRAVIEAMLHGVPVVATRCEALEEYMEDGHNGYLVDAETEEAAVERLAERILNVLQNGVPNDLQRNASQTASGFGVEAHVESMEALYSDLLGTKVGACVSA